MEEMKERQKGRVRGRWVFLIPLALTLFVILVDQISKVLVMATIVRGGDQGISLFGGFVKFVHVRNTALAFGIGAGLPSSLRFALIVFLPLGVVWWLGSKLLKASPSCLLQRTAVASMLGGGIGNLIDRVCRPEGVVDFISLRIYGSFGVLSWPTFNVADIAVVLGGIMYLATLFLKKNKPLLGAVPPSEETVEPSPENEVESPSPAIKEEHEKNP